MQTDSPAGVDREGVEAILLPCPFCGGTDIERRPMYLPPSMRGPGALISYEIVHHCVRQDGVVRNRTCFVGRDQGTAERAWNGRAALDAMTDRGGA